MTIMLPRNPQSGVTYNVMTLPTIPSRNWFYQVVDYNRIYYTVDPADSNEMCLAVETRKGDYTNGGERTEFGIQAGDEAGATRTYEWEVLFPTGYLEPASDTEWQHMGQFHDQPIPPAGWETHPLKSPNIDVTYQYSNVADFTQVITDYLDAHFPTWTTWIVGGRISTFAITIGITEPQPIVAIIPFQKNVWQKIKLEIKWSFDTGDGYVKFWHDDVLLSHTVGDNMHNDYPHFFKLGIYRRSIDQTNTVHYRNIKVL